MGRQVVSENSLALDPAEIHDAGKRVSWPKLVMAGARGLLRGRQNPE
jgi:hypothetical protein